MSRVEADFANNHVPTLDDGLLSSLLRGAARDRRVPAWPRCGYQLDSQLGGKRRPFWMSPAITKGFRDIASHWYEEGLDHRLIWHAPANDLPPMLDSLQR
jgi:hypothetical protein